MGFGRFIGGIGLSLLAVLLAFLGIATLLGFLNSYVTSNLALPLDIVMLIVALFLFAYGWYLYKSGKPQGTLRVEKG